MKYFLSFLILTSFASSSQNWNLINKNYRYNYRFNNASLVTHVIMADTGNSVYTNNTDTIYELNKIVVKCNGNSCPTFTGNLASLSASQQAYYISGMPQFLQRKVVKYANGITFFTDTAKLVINPNCHTGNTWLFDSINNKYITCVAETQQYLFNTLDSVKTLLINGTDSIKFSKQFGIYVWPALYGQNKYYRLSGIEHASGYAPAAWHGERVPNAWDFYNFQTGDVFTRNKFGYDYYPPLISFCYYKTIGITSKQITPTGYLYGANYIQYAIPSFTGTMGSSGCNYYFTTFPSSYNITSGAITLTHTGLNSKLLPENYTYPNQLINPNNSHIGLSNIMVYNKDAQGNFYKSAGIPCVGGSNIPGNYSLTTPANTIHGLTSHSVHPNIYISNLNLGYTKVYGTGFGLVSDEFEILEHASSECLNSVSRGGNTYFGGLFLSVADHKTSGRFNIYPNPSENYLKIDSPDNAIVEIYNMLGQNVYSQSIHGAGMINTNSLNNGIYTLNVLDLKRQLLHVQTIVVQH